MRCADRLASNNPFPFLPTSITIWLCYIPHSRYDTLSSVVEEFFKIFPDNHLVNNPYKILISEGDYTCSVADLTGTFKGPMKGLDGNMIQPTNKKFQLEFCTVAHWKNKKILEEWLFYDQVGMLKQISAL